MYIRIDLMTLRNCIQWCIQWLLDSFRVVVVHLTHYEHMSTYQETCCHTKHFVGPESPVVTHIYFFLRDIFKSLAAFAVPCCLMVLLLLLLVPVVASVIAAALTASFFLLLLFFAVAGAFKSPTVEKPIFALF